MGFMKIIHLFNIDQIEDFSNFRVQNIEGNRFWGYSQWVRNFSKLSSDNLCGPFDEIAMPIVARTHQDLQTMGFMKIIDLLKH